MTPSKKKKYVELLCKLSHDSFIFEHINNEEYFLLQSLIQDLSRTSLLNAYDMLELCDVKLVDFSQKPCRFDSSRDEFIEEYKVEFKDTFKLHYYAPKENVESLKENPELCIRMVIENVLKKMEEDNS